jgi:hypothetical protein
MSGARFASLHGGLLARKGTAKPAVATFDTALPDVAAPEAAPPAIKPETEEPAPEARAEPAPIAVEAPDSVEPPEPDPEPPAAESSSRTAELSSPVNGRKVETGMRPRMPERRRPPIFGKRGVIPMRASDTA